MRQAKDVATEAIANNEQPEQQPDQTQPETATTAETAAEPAINSYARIDALTPINNRYTEQQMTLLHNTFAKPGRAKKDGETRPYACACAACGSREFIALPQTGYLLDFAAEAATAELDAGTVTYKCASCGNSPGGRVRHAVNILYQAIMGQDVDFDTLVYTPPSERGQRPDGPSTLVKRLKGLYSLLSEDDALAAEMAAARLNLLERDNPKWQAAYSTISSLIAQYEPIAQAQAESGQPAQETPEPVATA